MAAKGGRKEKGGEWVVIARRELAKDELGFDGVGDCTNATCAAVASGAAGCAGHVPPRPPTLTDAVESSEFVNATREPTDVLLGRMPGDWIRLLCKRIAKYGPGASHVTRATADVDAESEKAAASRSSRLAVQLAYCGK